MSSLTSCTVFRLKSFCRAAAPGFLAAGLACATAQAQSVEIPRIVIYANQAATDASKVGSAVTVLIGNDLVNKGFNTLADALRTVPGVAVSQSGGRGALTQARIRGAESNQLLVMIDGVSVNSIDGGDFNFADFAIEDIERIEVIRGPQSGLYGANANSGVISVVTKSGRGLAKPEVNVRLEGGSMNTIDGGATARGSNGIFYGSVSADHNNTSGYNQSRFGSERDGSHATTFTTKLGADLFTGFNIEGALRYAERHTQFDAQPFFGPFEGLAADNEFDFNHFRGINGRVAATWSLFDGAFVQRLGASRYDETRHDDDVVFGFFNSEGYRNNFDYKATLKQYTQLLGGETHTLSFLADYQKEFLTMNSASLSGPFGDPAAASFWANGAERTRNGFAGEYALDLPWNMTLTSAVRRDDNSGFADITTWRETVAQRFPQMGTRLHASIGTGATNPTFTEQFGFFVGSFIGNPDLRPERSLGWDAGVEQAFWDRRLTVDVTYFASEVEDKIVTVSAGGGFLSTVVNEEGTSPRHGVEVTATATPTDWLSLSGTYTYTIAKLADGTPEIRRPKHTGSGSATVNLPDRRTHLTVNVIYNGAMPDTWFRFPLTPVTLEAYTTVGGILSYDVTPTTTAYLRAENVFNAHYEEVFSYRAPGFAAYAGLRAKFGS
jgi:vitamin B12 transporter